MHFRLICVGKIKTQATRALLDDFARRLRAYHSFEEIELRATPGQNPSRAITQDSDDILLHIAPHEQVWLLAIDGWAPTSEELAQQLAEAEQSGNAHLTLVIGGAYGVDHRVKARANRCWSLSRLTFLHEWARAIVVEQLYRASKILRHEPYHH